MILLAICYNGCTMEYVIQPHVPKVCAERASLGGVSLFYFIYYLHSCEPICECFFYYIVDVAHSIDECAKQWLRQQEPVSKDDIAT